MKRKLSSSLSLLLAVVLLMGVFPATALAANDEYVLTSINHLSAISVVNVTNTHAATFTVPYAHTGTVDFSNGLDITFDTAVYTSATASFPSGSVAAVGGEPVAMTVTYQRQDDATLYTAQYSLTVVRAAAAAPTFTGTVSKSVTLPAVLTFEASDFSNKYVKNDGGAMASIVIQGSNPTFGRLKWGSADYVYGTPVSVAELQAGILTFVPTTEGTVSFIVKAYAAGDTSTLIGAVTLTITAADNASAEDDGAGTVTYTTEKNTAVSFSASDFSRICQAVTGEELSYVYFTLPGSENGMLYYKYTSAAEYVALVTQTAQYFKSAEPCISNVDFVPAEDYEGTVTIAYTAYSIGNKTISGNVVITVGETEEESEHFSDVGRGHMWAAEAIDCLFERGIIGGDGKGHYSPSASISRGDFILMLCRAFDLNANVSGSFSDVEEGSYYSSAIATAKHLKIAKGAGGKFNPKSSLSRQDAMVLLVRAMEAADISLGTSGTGDLSIYSDSGKISAYAVDAVTKLVQAGIIEGSGGKLNPKANVSRAEMALILYRVLTD